ncbi:MAG: hypothetical protein ACI86X_001017 [Moritella sp.]|jgi:hypothetical protein
MVAENIAHFNDQKSYRLINSKFPPIDLFDDVASAEEFELLYEIQARTNPRIQNEVGDLNLISPEENPFGIAGYSYATASFTHVNPAGSRFSDGSFGALYMADTVETAIAETRYHQALYFSQVEGLAYDVITMRGLACYFDGALINISHNNDGTLYHPRDYTAAQTLGGKLKAQGKEGLQYNSVRREGAICWVLFTPKKVKKIEQIAQFEFIWDGKNIAKVEKVSKIF